MRRPGMSGRNTEAVVALRRILELFAVSEITFPDRLREIPCSIEQGIDAQRADFSWLVAALRPEISGRRRDFPVNSLLQ
jgi:hypothetical protein